MPSGAKKRKAARKKKENQSNNHSISSSSVSTRSHEKENVNHQGKKGIEKEIKIEQDGGSSGSYSSSNNSSDNESNILKNNEAAANIAPVVNPVKIAGSSSVRSTKVIDHAPVEKADDSVVENGKRKLSSNEDDDRLALPHNAPRASDGNGVTEPLLVPSPLPVQKTSWKSCCGLFEVFSGSGS